MIDVRVLGKLAVIIDGAEVPITAFKPKSLLAALVIAEGRPVTVEALVDRMWDGSPPLSSATGVQVFVSGLRKALGPDYRGRLVTSGRTYHLDLAADETDVGRFEAARRRGVQHAAAGQYQQASIAFAAALAEFRGAPLVELRGLQFADLFATAMENAYLSVQAAMYDAEIASGRASETIDGLRHLVQEHRTNEPLWAKLITALYLAGRQTEALATIRELKVFIDETTGMDLTPALAELELKVLRQEPLDFTPPQESTAEASPTDPSYKKTELDQMPGPALPHGVLISTEGHRHPVVGEVTLGRLPANDVVINDAKVSREHARVSSTATGFVVRDLGSSNGTWIGERRIRESAALVDGDEITIGRATFRLEIDRAGSSQ